MGKTIEIEVTVKVKVRLPLAGASASELALAVGPVRNEIGRELMRRIVESVQETIVERERLPRRAGRVNARRWSGADAHGPMAHAARCEVRAPGRRCREERPEGLRPKTSRDTGR